MGDLIRNEFLKLHRRHFFLFSFILILLSALLFTVVYYMQSDTRSDMDIVAEQLEREKTYLGQIETIQWETDLEMQSAILTSQATIDRLQYMLDHSIPQWDWRSDVLSKYYTNQTILSLLAAGQDPADYGYTDLGTYESKATLMQKLENLRDVQIRMVEENDYMTYSQEQLAQLQQTYAEQSSSMDTLSTVLMDIQIESWKLYIQYRTAPGAVDQWKSVTIQELADEKQWLARYQYDDQAFTDMTQEELERQKTWVQRRIRVNEYALKNDQIPLSIYDKMAERAKTTTYSEFVLAIKNMMRVVMTIAIALAASIMADEFRRRTIRQVVLAPYSRTQIAAAKLITLLISIVILSLLIPLFGMVSGRLLFSNTTIGQSVSSGAVPSFIAYIHGRMIEIPFHLYIVIHYLLEAFKIGVVAIITLMFATLTESVAVPLLVMTILSLAGPAIYSTIYTYVYPAAILRYMLFGNLELVQYIQGELIAPYPNYITSIIVLAVCTLGSLALYFTDFKYKDLPN